ncbi:MAG: V-type ATP synthase subunit D [Candidatus Micrarchaeota archaeon]|nr:V-type ATP synthase subunit D [Candidatus Micrarchaeota archaeon]MBU1887255.1 V-type ATP synthase subunit D [Candidatus Micrarchaeota archaeon]
MAATDVNPTRMELIKTKERIVLAKKGHKLLKQKRDALILEFFKILKKAQDLRGELANRMKRAYGSLALAETYHNIQELSKVSLDLRKDIDIEIDVQNVMGVKIPNITTTMETKHFMSIPSYSVAATSAKIDAAVEDFDEVLKMVIKLAETETAMKRLILEIEKTKRRVNALEYVLIPRLDEQKRMISFRLEEMERDSFVSLKAIKRRLEKEKASI